PNGIGLFDLAGNVAEWCLDWYGPYEAGPVTDPLETRQNLSDKPRRVLRGGSWLRDPKNGRSAARHRNAAGTRNADNGFRIVADTSASAPAAAPAAAATGSEPAGKDESPGGMGPLAKLVGMVVALFVASKIVARLFGRGSAGVKTEISPDGFALRAPRVPMGHRIHYRYMMDGKTQTGSIVASGDSEMGQTVYTGGRPSSVQVLAITAPGQALPAEKPRPVHTPDNRVTTRTDDDSFRGYPSAY
ncbi:MAG TPA: SUMF1/EgtB/PvdO family nonheme iron enzyme, partial [Vicinamibacteria bacterium]|nr:SUMF1/EgtB/PvdO family nonheme iron enzyme [Vicinamibacteria bacterium]